MMRNKSVVYCTLLCGIGLLAAQVSLLAFLLFPQSKSVEYSFGDIETLINITLQADLMIIGIDEQILKNLQPVNTGRKDKCIICDEKDVVTFAILLTETSQHVSSLLGIDKIIVKSNITCTLPQSDFCYHCYI